VSLAVVGSVAFDSITTPFGEVERELGGSATHAALAASRYTDVRLVSPVGEDFTNDHFDVLERARVDTDDVTRITGGRTFFWRGRYDFDLSIAHTEETELNVFEGWHPRLSRVARSSDILFLAAMDPEIQAEVRAQWRGERASALDTNGYWIETKRTALLEAIGTVDFVLMNDREARALTRQPMLLHAARTLMELGPQAVVLKLGEYGCAVLHRDGYFSLPGYPLEAIADPTGAGDAFAGGFLGYLDLVPGGELTESVLRRAVTFGSVMASYVVEDFGTKRIVTLSENEIQYRADEFRRMTHFEHVPTTPLPRSAEEPGETRLARPEPTAGTPSYTAPAPSAGTRHHDPPQRTPSTETLHAPSRPLPHREEP
jgi:sugar/nucleoside kinase (ribokinase family)